MGSSGAPELTHELSNNPRAGGRAAILAIGTAVPVHVYEQKSFPDYYFEITNSNHLVDLKAKFANICKKTTTEKRHMYISDEWLRANPSVTAYMSTSLNVRQQVAEEGIPRLGAEEACNAIGNWGKPASSITQRRVRHHQHRADVTLIKLLGLPLSTKRVMLYQSGCFGGTTALRVAKDIAESNRDARVLVVTSEVMSLIIRGPSESHVGNLVAQAVFGDAAGAAVVGCCRHPSSTGERPVFQLVRASQDVIPGTDDAVVVKVQQEGVVITLHRDLPLHVSNAIGGVVESAFRGVGTTVTSYDEAFWLLHAGGRAVVDGVEERLGLGEGKLAVTREVMRQYGNTRSTTIFLAMEEMRRRSEERGMATAGEGLEWGMLMAFGPGLTVETMLLRAMPRN
uniref:Chalcone synthase n=1 Tax=Oryza rufipogon TaxID=4529 RepID=A0A0E0P737_ORYRU